MNVMWNLSVRNIKVYVRDRMSVFFSFLSVLIIIALYALFLGKIQVDSITDRVGDVAGVRYLVDSWIMSGLLGINAVTVALGVLGTMVQDVEKKQFTDFIVAPVNRTAVVVSYLVSAVVISLAFSIVALLISEVYIVLGGGQWLTLPNLLEALGILILSSLTAASILYLVVSFQKTSSAFATLSTLLGTMIGFLTGVYVPLGILPAFVQKFVLLVPFSHSAALLRQVFLRQPVEMVFHGAPQAAVDSYLRSNGVVLLWGDQVVSTGVMLAVLGGAAVLGLVLSALRMRSYKQK